MIPYLHVPIKLYETKGYSSKIQNGYNISISTSLKICRNVKSIKNAFSQKLYYLLCNRQYACHYIKCDCHITADEAGHHKNYVRLMAVQFLKPVDDQIWIS